MKVKKIDCHSDNYYNGNSILPKKIVDKNNFISKGFTINAEIIIFALKLKKLNYVEVPFHLEKRKTGENKAIRPLNILIFFSIYKINRKYNEK
jgi:hypothetical protein